MKHLYTLSIALCLLITNASAEPLNTVKFERTPNQGLQPQVDTDAQGNVHLVYVTGDARKGDLWYVKRTKVDAQWSEPIQVNQQPGSVLYMGTVRGPRMSISPDGTVHVVWMGSSESKLKGPDNQPPLLYTHLNTKTNTFIPARNIIQNAWGLDGGCSVTADQKGNVYIIWHAHGTDHTEKHTEENRRVYIRVSNNNGINFQDERAIDHQAGVCGCCGIDVYCNQQGYIYIIYRSAKNLVNRDVYLLVSNDKAQTFNQRVLDRWEVRTCPMSTAYFVDAGQELWLAWETHQRIRYTSISQEQNILQSKLEIQDAAKGKGMKHPVIAANETGDTIITYVKNAGWGKGGNVNFDLITKQNLRGKPKAGQFATPKTKAWSRPAVYYTDHQFIILY